MKIKRHDQFPSTKYYQLASGDVFAATHYDGPLFIKTNSGTQAVRVDNGSVISFESQEEVYPKPTALLTIGE